MQPSAAKPPRMGRVNWTQATTTTVAAFIGCLLALAACVLIYKYMLSDVIRRKQAQLDALSNQVDDITYRVVGPAEKRKPIASYARPVETADVDQASTPDPETPEADSEKQETYVPNRMPGEPIKTTNAV